MLNKKEVVIPEERSKGLITSAPDIFVLKDDEEKYCRAHNIEYRKFENGIQLVGMSRIVEDMASATVNFSFQQGAYSDPEGKSGLHHFVEHLTAYPLLRPAREVDASMNARTYPLYLDYIFDDAIANPQVQTYGLWPMLPVVRDELGTPFCNIDNLDQAIEIEKKVVLSEINEVKADPESCIRRLFNKCLFAEENPIITDVLGTEDDIRSFTRDDVFSLADGLFVPRKLLISVFSNGESKNANIISDQIEELFINFPKKNDTQPARNWDLLDRIHPDLQGGNLYEQDADLNSNNVRVIYAWVFEDEPYTVEHYAQDFFMQQINNNLFHYIRDQGLGYSYGTSTIDLDKQQASRIGFTTKSIPHIGAYMKNIIYPKIRQQVFQSLSEDQMDALLARKQKQIQATPIASSTRFNSIVNGLIRYGRIVDIDQLKSMHEQISIDHIRQWRDRFLATEPVTIVIGDLRNT